MYIRPQIEQHLYIMHVDKMNLSRYTSTQTKNPHRYDKSVFILKDKRNPRRVLNTAYGSDSIVICTWFKHLILQDCFFLYLQTMMFAKSLLMCVSNFDICSYSLKPY